MLLYSLVISFAVYVQKGDIAVMLSMRKFEGFLETIDILSDPELMRQFKESAKDIKAGRLIDLDEAF